MTTQHTDDVRGRPGGGERRVRPDSSPATTAPAARRSAGEVPGRSTAGDAERHRPLAVVVLGAGDDDAMRSVRPKPLQRLCGRPMVLHVLDAAAALRPERVVVVLAPGGDRVARVLHSAFDELLVDVVTQPLPLGTADAVAAALTAFPDTEIDDDADGDLLVVPADHPLLTPELLADFVDAHRTSGAAATILTTHAAAPAGRLRVERGKGGRIRRLAVAEEPPPAAGRRRQDRDPNDSADDHVDAVGLDGVEVGTSLYCFRQYMLGPALRRIAPSMREGRVQPLGRVIEVLADAGYGISSFDHPDGIDIMGVDSRAELAAAERELRRRTNRRLLDAGVNLVDPEHVYVDATVTVEADATLFPGVILQGDCVIGAHAEIGPGCRLVDTDVGEGAVLEHTVARGAAIGSDAVVGPFAVLEPGAKVGPGTRTGPFFKA